MRVSSVASIAASCLVLVGVVPQAATAAVILSDDFDDGAIGTNTGGVGTGFDAFGTGTVSESGTVSGSGRCGVLPMGRLWGQRFFRLFPVLRHLPKLPIWQQPSGKPSCNCIGHDTHAICRSHYSSLQRAGVAREMS